MNRSIATGGAPVLIVLATLGCAGDGSGIADEMLDPDGMPPARVTLASLQQSVFTPFCTDCHVPGGIGPMPLDSEAATLQNLVGVDSVEILGLDRVAPGDPEMSYLVWKVEGRPGILFDRMPPPPKASLDAARIEAIKEWIRQGAQP